MDAVIGRDVTVAALQRLVDVAIGGSGRLALIAGDAGIGKTTMVEAAARYAADRGAAVVWGVCVGGAGVPVYWPWQQVLSELGADPLPAGTGAGAAGDEGWFAVGSAVVAAIAAATTRPVVVVLDDLHWAGGGCVRLLDFAARQLRRAPVLLLGTFRDVEVDADHPLSALIGGAEVVALTGLDETEVAAMLRPVLGERADDLSASVTQRTAGNPFFVQQIGRLLAASPGPSSASVVRVPAAISEVINRRIARLAEPTAQLLDAASVAGIDVDAALVATAAEVPYPDVVARLDEAVAARVLQLTGIGRYRFDHDLFRETRYQGLDPAVRARTHRAIAEALVARRAGGADVRLGDIAHHYAHAVPAVAPDAAVAQVTAAATEAEERLAHEEAARHWAVAIRLAEVAGTVPAGLRLRMADAQLRAGDRRSARATYLMVATGEPDALTLGHAVLGVHRCGTTSGVSTVQTTALLDRARAALGRSGEEPALAALISAALARDIADGPDVDLSRARILVAEAVALAESAAGRPALAFCLLALHDVEWSPGTAERRLAVADQMAGAARAAGLRDLECEALLCRFVALVELADPSAALALSDLEASAERLGQPHYRFLARSRRAAFTIATCDFSAGEREMTEARDLGDAIGEPDGAAVHVTQFIMMSQLRGGALGLGRAVQAYGTAAMPPELAPHEQALRHLADGQVKAAAAIIRTTVGPDIRAMYRWRALAEAALVIEIAVAADLPDVCEIRYRNLLPYAGGFVVIGGVVAILGPVDLYLGLAASAMGDAEAARRHLTDAAALADRFGAPAFAARARVELAQVLRTIGDEPEANRAARQAGEAADRLGLDLVRERVAALQSTPDAQPAAAWRRTDQVWTLTFDGHSAQLPDAKGLHDLALLLSVAGREVSALRLVGEAEPDTGADEILDEQARAAYKARLHELDSTIESAEARGDDQRSDRLRAERQALIKELTRAYGLGGRARHLGDRGERARSTVTARIRDTLRRIERVHPALAAHLRASVTTGRSCVYRPAQPIRWHVEPHGL